MAYINGRQILFSVLEFDNEDGTEGLTYDTSEAEKICTGMGSCLSSDIVLAKKIDDNAITIVGESAFRYEKLLTSVIIPEGYLQIRSYSFADCTSLEKISIPSAVMMINYAAFLNCTSLKSIKIPSAITIISNNAFKGCTSLLKVSIPNTIPKLSPSMFYGCTSLTDIFFGGTTAEWEALTKETNWNYNTGEYTIHCTDGELAKS